MHECPECGMVCDCDGEDVWNDAAAETCEHECEDDEIDTITYAQWLDEAYN